jgi:hypothetical protein
VIDGLIEWPVAIEGDTHLSSRFPVDILDTATTFGKLGVVAVFSRLLRKEQWTAEALGAIAIGMVELVGRMHAQALGTQRGAIDIAFIHRMGVLVEGHGSDAAMEGGALIHIAGVEGGSSRDIGGIGF